MNFVQELLNLSKENDVGYAKLFKKYFKGVLRRDLT